MSTEQFQAFKRKLESERDEKVKQQKAHLSCVKDITKSRSETTLPRGAPQQPPCASDIAETDIKGWEARTPGPQLFLSVSALSVAQGAAGVRLGKIVSGLDLMIFS